MHYYTYKKTKPTEDGWYLVFGETIYYPHVEIAKWSNELNSFRTVRHVLIEPDYWARVLLPIGIDLIYPHIK